MVSTGRPILLWPYTQIGQKVRIANGPLASLRGVVMRVKDSWRVVVSVEALTCSVAIEVEADMIAPETDP